MTYVTNKLTPRERDVLEMIAKGKTRLQTAESLGVSETTIISHRKHAFEKLGAVNAAQAIFKAFQQGIFKVTNDEL